VPPLYLVQQGAKIRINNRRVRVEMDPSEAEGSQPEILLQVPIGQVSQVILFGNIGLTTPAISTFLEMGIDVVFLTQNGEYRGQLSGGLTPHVPIRRAQYKCLAEPQFSLRTARGIVSAKLQHQRALLQRRGRELPHQEIQSAADRLAGALQSVDRKTTLQSLRGLEGAASAAYFSGFRRLFEPAWNFNTRQRRPPGDPVNVLLSFGYTLLAHSATGAAQAAGLDPYAGFFHEVVYNRPALGLDLMEEFRPVVDGVVLWACRSEVLTPADFTPGPPERPVVMNDDAKKRFIKAFEERMNREFLHPIRQLRLPLRQCLLEQARQIAARVVEERAGYQGMGFR
jgi:CRISPR-associated protein Cas1